MSFGALLFIYITKRINILPPFDSLISMLTDTTYNVVSLKGSIADIAIKVLINTFNIIYFVDVVFCRLIDNLLTFANYIKNYIILILYFLYKIFSICMYKYQLLKKFIGKF